MFEKFNQFNRQDNSKKIKEGFGEGESFDDQINGGSREEKKDSTESRNSLEKDVEAQEKEIIFTSLKVPRDILTLPAHLRKEALGFIREKVSERYLFIAKMKAELFNYIDELHETEIDELNLIKLVNENIDKKISQHDFSREDRLIIREIFDCFCDNYKKIHKFKNIPKEDLLEKFIKNQKILPLIDGEYNISITPYAVHFSFSNLKDFQLFVSRTEDEATKEYYNTVGMSYYQDGCPLTASGGKYKSKEILQHETQHKKFFIIGSDTRSLLSEEEVERRTRNEILAFLAGNDVSCLFTQLKEYNFNKRHIISDDKYEKILQNSINYLQKLISLNFDKDEIMGLLSKEKLTDWPKIIERIKNSNVGKNLIRQKKLKKSAFLREKYESEIAKNNEMLMKKIEPILAQGLMISRKINKNGKFFEKIAERTIIELLKRESIILKKENIYLPQVIDKTGEYKIELCFYGKEASFVLKVEAEQ